MAKTIAIDPNEVTQYVPKADRDAENPPTFALGLLPRALRRKVEDATAKYQLNGKGDDAKADVTIAGAQRNEDAVRYALRGWTNFKDAKGNDVPFKGQRYGTPPVDGAADADLDKLPFDLITELGDVILHGNRLTEEEVKN